MKSMKRFERARDKLSQDSNLTEDVYGKEIRDLR